MFNALLPFQPQTSGVLLTVRVIPKAASNRLGDVMHDTDSTLFLKVYVTAVPEDGAANAAVIKLLSKSWGLPKNVFEIIRGHKDRKKVIRIHGNPQELMKQLRICF